MNLFEASDRYPNYPLWRLTVSGSTFSLADHHTAARSGPVPTIAPVRLSGKVGEEPDWLKRILAVGQVGGYAVRVKSPPPEIFLWFVTTKQGELITFVDPT